MFVIEEVSRFSICVIIITFGLWAGFPIWISKKRAERKIVIEKPGLDGKMRQTGMLFELGIFIFVIPSMLFIFFVFFNFLLSVFIKESANRVTLSFQLTAIMVDCALVLYIYIVENKKE